VADDDSQRRKPDFRTAIEDVKALATVLAMEAEAVLGRRTARVLGVVVLFAVLVVTLLALLDWYIAPSGAEQKQALVVTLAQILGGTALLSGLYFTWRTLQVNREGQITERFTRAIDQLGRSNELEIRLGGIYALERIARDSERDHWPIMEVLTAYVRQHAPWRPEEDSGEEPKTPESSPPDPDIQAILTVLGRRTRTFVHKEPERLDLHETNLSRANLSRANLSFATLTRADLSEAMLDEANLTEAWFWMANLSGATFGLADLSRATLMLADLSRADLSGANGLEQGQLYEAKGDEKTRLPPGFSHLWAGGT
jgi:hypothetical protein